MLAGEGFATLKWDGTACAVINGHLYKRYDAKRGKTPPAGAIPCSDPDPVTGHHPHWVLVGDEPDSKWHREAMKLSFLTDGTYELCGPHFQGNPHKLEFDMFIPHGKHIVFIGLPRTFEAIRASLEDLQSEGIVFHRKNGDMCKIRRDDYGFPWPLKETS